jgi:hypothetical protein
MLIYHGSNMEVSQPRLIAPIRGLDFGMGFYTTTNLEQARRFADNVVERNDGQGEPTISVFEVDFDKVKESLIVRNFDAPDGDWLDFVRDNRLDQYKGEQPDIVFGPVANDTIFRTFRQYERGDISREETINRLKISKLYNQMTFCTERAIAQLKFIRSEVTHNG